MANVGTEKRGAFGSDNGNVKTMVPDTKGIHNS